jgi:hypothetical protein
MPIDYRVAEGDAGLQRLRNVSAGGICFSARQAMDVGATVRISISIGDQDFEADGEVMWCEGVNGHHEVGVRFRDAATVFTVRMVEQLCYIEQYRQQVLHAEGRDLSSEEAASEWVSRYAADFPQLDS